MEIKYTLDPALLEVTIEGETEEDCDLEMMGLVAQSWDSEIVNDD